MKRQNPYLSDPDVVLMLEFQKGNKLAFEKLMERNYKHILNIIYRFVGSEKTAEDLTQEVFVKIYKNASFYRPTAKFQTWAYRIAKNLSLNELRRHKNKYTSIEETAKDFADDTHSGPAQELLKQETTQIIQSAINSLPENQRSAVILRRYENLSYEDIAKTMNCSVKAVKSLLNRAKENLRNFLQPIVFKD